LQDILIVVLVLGILAMLPFVPATRPMAKKVIMLGLTMLAATATAAAVASEQWKDVVAEAQAEHQTAAQAKMLAAEPETITISLE